MNFKLFIFKNTKSLLFSIVFICFLILLNYSIKVNNIVNAKPNMINTWPNCPPQSNMIWVKLDSAHSPTKSQTVVQIPFDSGTIQIGEYEYDNYIRGVLAGEVATTIEPDGSMVIFDNSTLKAMAVAIRTKVYHLCGRSDYFNSFLDNKNITRRGVRGQGMQDYQYNKAVSKFTIFDLQRYQDTIDKTDGKYITYSNNTFDIFYRTIGGEDTKDKDIKGPHKGVYDPAGVFHTEINDDPGLLQFNANHWATGQNHGDVLPTWNYYQILTHYYTGVHITNTNGKLLTPAYRWNPLTVNWGGGAVKPPDMLPNSIHAVNIQLQNSGTADWILGTTKLTYRWKPSSLSGQVSVPAYVPGESHNPITAPTSINLSVKAPSKSGKYDLIIDMLHPNSTPGGSDYFASRETDRPWYPLHYTNVCVYDVSDKRCNFTFLPIIRKEPTPVPTLTPVPTSTPVPCIENQDLIVNGGLENTSNHYLWVQKNGSSLINTVKPYQGIYGIQMGGQNNTNREIYQVITLPNNIKSVTVKFKFQITTTEYISIPYDYLYWDIKDKNGNSLLETRYTFDQTASYAIDTWITQYVPFTNIDRITEKQIRLSISDKTDRTNITSFFIDNIKFITHCNK